MKDDTDTIGADADVPSLKEESKATAAAAAPPPPSPPDTRFLKNLAILPPLQEHEAVVTEDTVRVGATVPLPPIRAEEPVSSLRAALGEVSGYAHLTNYRFTLETSVLERTSINNNNNNNSTASSKSTNPSDVVSPFTGPDAVVSCSVAIKSLEKEPSPLTSSSTQASQQQQQDKEEIVLDDYGDLQPLLEKGLADGSSFRIVLERYDAASVRDHVTKLRVLFDGNAPSVVSLADDASPEPKAAGTTNEEPQQQVVDASAADKDGDNETTNATNIDTEERTNTNDKNSNVGSSNEKIDEKGNATNKSMVAKKGESAEMLEKHLEQTMKMADKMPTFPIDQSIKVDGSNLKDFFYLVCGEEQAVNEQNNGTSSIAKQTKENAKEKKKLKKKNKRKGDNNTNTNNNNQKAISSAIAVTNESNDASQLSQQEKASLMNDLDERARVKCTIRYSGFHPPPPSRRLMGDLAYLEVTTTAPQEPTFHITAMPTGFFVNQTKTTTTTDGDGPPSYQFNPSPAKLPCFSHELLDCLLQKSQCLRQEWSAALKASQDRAELTSSAADSPLQALFRVATRGDFSGSSSHAAAGASTGIDTVVLRPSWLVPIPKNGDTWNHNSLHEYNTTRTEDDLSNMFGIDVKNGSIRDWNEELQSARELPTIDLNERIDRARLIHKVLTDFGEASVTGARAIFDGHVAPMNPNEPTRSHVYLHNNIFFSRAVDAGIETFKICKGDRAAKKSATRDAQCMGALHRLDVQGLHTLGTVLVDYLGTRFVCQSIVPGILLGEKTHTLLYGSVEATSPLAFDKEMHELLDENLGTLLMVASRDVPKLPLSDERIEEIEAMRSTAAFLPPPKYDGNSEDKSLTTTVCGPIEAKGIRGSDQRTYVLDLIRLTPRDANWVPQAEGGTGKWEEAMKADGKSKRAETKSLDDDVFMMAVLRQEIVTRFTQRKMNEYLEEKKKNGKDSEKESAGSGSAKDETPENVLEKDNDNDDEKLSTKDPAEEDEAFLKSLRLNVNVFLPNTRSMEEIDSSAHAQLKEDEKRAREAASMLWDEVLPRITKDIKEGTGNQVPVDGKNLTDFLHQRGVNCRYLGRLAALAAQQEAIDRKVSDMIQASKVKQVPRRVMPQCWLELLECEMIARAAKHVMDSYLTENGCCAAIQPSQTIASFLSALISDGEETAAQTEKRLGQKTNSGKSREPDEDDFNALAMFDTGGKGDAVPPPVRSRGQVWDDIEREVGRRFRYTLSLYNISGSSGRALYIPLLRRVCQRTGVRLIARNYAVGGKCLCSGGNSSGGRFTASYPISPVDITDVVPLVKHSAAHGGEGFTPYTLSASGGPPSLHIVLPDAKATLDAAHLHYQAKALHEALDLAQEASSLYQRITDTPLHASVARCLDLTSAILFEANEPQLAAANAARSLGLVVQLNGFDCADAMTAHSTMSHIFLSSGIIDGGIQHLRAATYLMEVMAGPRYAELSNAYHKLGSLYHEVGDGITALRFYQEAASRYSSDRLMEGMIAKSTALVLAGLGQFKPAVACEKNAYRLYSLLVGDEHELTKNSAATLNKLTKLAVDQGTRNLEDNMKRKEEETANAIASQIEADEMEEEKKKKKGKKKKKKN